MAVRKRKARNSKLNGGVSTRPLILDNDPDKAKHGRYITQATKEKFVKGELDKRPQFYNKAGETGLLLTYMDAKEIALKFEYKKNYFLKECYLAKLDKTDVDYELNIHKYTYNLTKRRLAERAKNDGYKETKSTKDCFFVIYERSNKQRFAEIVFYF